MLSSEVNEMKTECKVCDNDGLHCNYCNTAELSESTETHCYPTYFVKGKGLVGMTAQELARELDIHVDRVEVALINLINKGMVRVIKSEDRK